MISRRLFLRHSTAIAAGSLLTSSCFAAKKKTLIGLQLYSMRDFVPKDPENTIRRIAEAGYTNLETYGWNPKNGFWGKTPSEFRGILKQNGLNTTSGHYSAEDFFFKNGPSDEWKKIADAAAAMEQQYAILPWVPAEYRSEATFQKLAGKLNEAGEICKKAGIKAAYHNHDFEFSPIGNSYALEYLLKGTDPDLVDFELDIFWAVFAKKDPVALFKEFPGRFKMWHVKDMSKTNPHKNTEIGSGTIDYKRIFENASLSGMKYFFVEQENFDIDGFKSIAQSCNYIKKTLI